MFKAIGSTGRRKGVASFCFFNWRTVPRQKRYCGRLKVDESVDGGVLESDTAVDGGGGLADFRCDRRLVRLHWRTKKNRAHICQRSHISIRVHPCALGGRGLMVIVRLWKGGVWRRRAV